MYCPELSEFESFSLERLLRNCFGSSDQLLSPCILIDLDDPAELAGFSYLSSDSNRVQKVAKHEFLDKLNGGVGEKLNFSECHIYSYRKTGGSNLDPEDTFYDIAGNVCSLRDDICKKHDIILAITDFSLTAPLTALCKEFGFRGATLHGVNDVILNSGLSVDYNEVSKQAEAFRSLLDTADSFTLDFSCLGKSYSLTISCGGQTAQKSHGLCPPGKPDVANLPAGEVYFVPTGAEGSFPFRFSDGTLSEMVVENGSIVSISKISGDDEVIKKRSTQLNEDPATGIIGELGFGTQLLPFSGQDIQDEKIFGTCHVATGRSDHLGGNLTPQNFLSKMNATHDDILFAPPKTPEIVVEKVSMSKDGEVDIIFESFKPSDFLKSALVNSYPMDKIFCC